MAALKTFANSEIVFKNSNWGLSMFESKIFSYRLDIKHFMELPKTNGEVHQVVIPTDGQSSTDWRLNVYPNGKYVSNKDLSVLIHRLSFHSSSSPVNARYSIELRDSSNNLIASPYSEYAKFHNTSEHGVYDYITRDALQKALEHSINGTLTILCVINEFTHVINLPGPPIRVQSHASDVLKTMLTDQVRTDFTINVKDRQFKVHKSILQICSPVFRTMFNTELSEKENNETTVDDVQPDIFEKIVEFMYTGNVASIYDNAMELLPVAHKYDLKGLLEQCEVILCSQISIEKAVKMYMFSNVYTLEYLRNATIAYIKANLSDISETPDWKTYVANDPKFLTLLLMGQ